MICLLDTSQIFQAHPTEGYLSWILYLLEDTISKFELKDMDTEKDWAISLLL